MGTRVFSFSCNKEWVEGGRNRREHQGDGRAIHYHDTHVNILVVFTWPLPSMELYGETVQVQPFVVAVY